MPGVEVYGHEGFCWSLLLDLWSQFTPMSEPGAALRYYCGDATGLELPPV